MNKKIIFIIACLLVVIGVAIFLYKGFFNNNPLAQKVATVNGISISKDELNKQITFTKNFYEYSKQNLANYQTLEKDALDRLIEDKLVEEYAREHNIRVADEEVLVLYKQKISRQTENELLSRLKTMYGMEKEDYLKVLRKDLLREKVQKKLGIPLLRWLNEQKKEAEISIIN